MKLSHQKWRRSQQHNRNYDVPAITDSASFTNDEKITDADRMMVRLKPKQRVVIGKKYICAHRDGTMIRLRAIDGGGKLMLTDIRGAANMLAIVK